MDQPTPNWEALAKDYEANELALLTALEAAGVSVSWTKTGDAPREYSVAVESGNRRRWWLDVGAWRACQNATLRIDSCWGLPCFVGMDASGDILSRCMIFTRAEGGLTHYFAFFRHYNGDFGAGIREELFKREIEEDGRRFGFQCIVFDAWSGGSLLDKCDLLRKCKLISIPQTMRHLSPATKELQSAILSGRFHYDGDPVLSEAIILAELSCDANENVIPRRPKNGPSISPVLALLNAMSRAIVRGS